MPKAARVLKRVLNRAPTDAGLRRDRVDVKIACGLVFDLACNDAQHGSLMLCVVLAHRLWHAAISAK